MTLSYDQNHKLELFYCSFLQKMDGFTKGLIRVHSDSS